jgi:hypothetical protein
MAFGKEAEKFMAINHLQQSATRPRRPSLPLMIRRNELCRELFPVVI